MHAWLVSDIVKSAFAACETCYGAYLASSPTTKNRAFILLIVGSAITLFLLAIGLHDPYRFPFEAILVLSTFNVGFFAAIVLLLAHKAASAHFAAANLMLSLGPFLESRLAAVLLLTEITIIVSMVLTFVEDQARWTSLRLFAISVTAFAGGLYYVYKLHSLRKMVLLSIKSPYWKRSFPIASNNGDTDDSKKGEGKTMIQGCMLMIGVLANQSSNQTSQQNKNVGSQSYKSSERRVTSVCNSDVVRQRKIILVSKMSRLIAIGTLCALVAGSYFFVVGISRSQTRREKGWKSVIDKENESYSPLLDAALYIALLANAYFLYFAKS
mmetsp:Transcript_15177/g.37198  ORF Transcript_15177/g.37198 Transcript_15177/m.37198 type:complete len:326 (+) Transcript_15177:65-1042(+)